jgi:small subunit ribosomal protein S3Ae
MAKEKWKGKEWFQIKAPEYFKNVVIGETPTFDNKLVKGRVVEASLIELTNDPGKYYIKFFFKVTDLDANVANTKFHGHVCTKDYIARIVQVRTSRIDTNNIVELKDGKLRIKGIAITNRRVKVSLKSDIRKAVIVAIKEEVGKLTTKDFIKAMIEGKLQNEIKKDLTKLYPVRFFEFRKTEVIE